MDVLPMEIAPLAAGEEMINKDDGKRKSGRRGATKKDKMEDGNETMMPKKKAAPRKPRAKKATPKAKPQEPKEKVQKPKRQQKATATSKANRSKAVEKKRQKESL